MIGVDTHDHQVDAGFGLRSDGPQRRSEIVVGIDVTLVDAGETIEPGPEGFGSEQFVTPNQVDFRYIGDTALILTLDGGIKSESTFLDFEEFSERPYRVRNLDQRGN